MKQFLISLTGFLLLPVTVFSQGKMVKHTVMKNETVSEIAEKYNTSSYEIYRLNPDSKKGIKPNTILLVQPQKEADTKNKADKNKSAQQKSSKSAKVHTVVSGDSFYSLSKTYGVSIEDIKKANPDLKPSGLQLGTELNIPSESDSKKNDKEETKTKSPKTEKVEKTEKLEKVQKAEKSDLTEKVTKTEKEAKADKKEKIVKSEKTEKADQTEKVVKEEKSNNKEKVVKSEKTTTVVFHDVIEGDTKFSIAKKYGITIQQLDDANPEITNNLPIGSKLKIIEGNSTTLKEGVSPVKSRYANASKALATSKKLDPITYEVKPKETLYGLTKKFSIHPDALVAMNPELKEGVREGMILKLPGNTVIAEEPVKPVVDLGKQINLNVQDKKELVLLLPFNLSKIEKDSANTVASRLKMDKFLNLTLDFYSGALMAIDSAKTLGMNIDVKIYDSQETRNASSVASLIQSHGLDKANAVIGPFYQANVEKTAEILGKYNVPVISPLSKDAGKPYANLLHSMPSTEMAKNAVFNYMHNKNGNILAILDSKKISSKMYFTQNHKDVKLVGLNEKSLVVSDSVVKKLTKDKINFVILDSEKTNLILKTLNTLIALQADYPIQLVILEKNDALDFEEIPLAKLAKLKLLYPSFTRTNETPEASIFANEYKAKNKIFPNQYATRGFDVTFDTMLRLSQEGGLMGNLDKPTEQIESQFRYEKKDSGYVNEGIYILYYDGDLSVKEAK